MKLSIIRAIKIRFTQWKLHVLFQPFSNAFLNLVYLTRFSAWAAKNGKIQKNDFPSKWDYNKRFTLYNWVLQQENLGKESINYIEFGVADGFSIKWFVEHNIHPQTSFTGFDTFTGLPEDFGVYKKGEFNRNNQIPEIADQRVQFHTGLFQQTLPDFLRTLDNSRRNLVMLDADLYSSTLYALTSLAPFLKKGDLIFFDEFSVPTHEFRAFHDFTSAYYTNLQLIGTANNYYFSVFKVL